MNFVIGIDVGGEKKGYHGAVMEVGSKRISSLFHLHNPGDVVTYIDSIRGRCLAIAIDSPPKARIKGQKTRLAERELHKAGYRLQWTPRKASNIQEWMKNGERLWDFLRDKYRNKNVNIIETFPTAASDGLADKEVQLGLNLLAGKENRKFYKDYIDACICALVAESVLQNKTKVYGRDDELGPIHTL